MPPPVCIFPVLCNENGASNRMATVKLSRRSLTLRRELGHDGIATWLDSGRERARQRRGGLHNDAVLVAEIDQLVVVPANMRLNLIHGGQLNASVDHALDRCNLPVRHADRPDLLLLLHLDQRVPGFGLADNPRGVCDSTGRRAPVRLAVDYLLRPTHCW
jgi:hypothetical protein